MESDSMRIFYAQSGGVTSVINATCAGLLKAAKINKSQVLIGLNGIHGVFDEKFIDSNELSDEDIELLSKTPGGSFGSCRYKVQPDDHPKIISFIKKYRLDAFVYHGGNDSMDTSAKIYKICKEAGLNINVIGLPKTIDNDLFGTDQCPGFGSASKYLNVSFDEASLDLTSMCRDSTKVFILETMGRHAGWLAASCGLTRYSAANHLLLVPEKSYDLDDIAEKINSHVNRSGFCTVALSEGAPLKLGQSTSSFKDSFGHTQLGGIGLGLHRWLKDELNLKSHLAISDYLQRSAGHCLSKTDYDQAFSLGSSVIELIQSGFSGKMLTIVRTQSSPYKWEVGSINLDDVANKERLLPQDYLNDDHQLTTKAKEYFQPLICGEVEIPWSQGLPVYWEHRLSVQSQK